MKLLYVPLIAPGGASEQFDLEAAFQDSLGTVNVGTFDFLASSNPNAELLQLADDFRPTHVHFQLQETQKFHPDAIGKLRAEHPGIFLSDWCGDVRPKMIDHLLELHPLLDLALFVSDDQSEDYEKVTGTPSRYWQNAVGPRFFVAQEYDPDGPVVFCGNRYDPHIFPAAQERLDVLLALAESFPDRLEVYGNGWGGHLPDYCVKGSIPWEDQPQVYAGASVTIGHNHINTLRRYFSDRQLICMAAGRPHVCRSVPGLDEVFRTGWTEEGGAECVTYSDPELAVQRVAYVLSLGSRNTTGVVDYGGDIEQIGIDGQAAIRSSHTWETRVKEYLEIVEEVRG